MPRPMVATPSASEGGRLIAEKLPLYNTTRDCGLHESILDKSYVSNYDTLENIATN